MRFAWPNDWTHQTKCRRVLEWATASGQPSKGFSFCGHKVQHLTSTRLPLPAARILSGSVPSAYWIWSAKGRSHTILELNADAAVLHLNSNLSVGLGFSSLGNSNDDLAFAREFHGVADQVDQDLAHAPRISAQSGWDAALIALASSMSFARVSLAHNSKVLSTKSLMIVSSASQLARIISAYSRCCGARSPSSNKPVIPITRSSGYLSRGSSDSDHGDQNTYLPLSVPAYAALMILATHWQRVQGRKLLTLTALTHAKVPLGSVLWLAIR
jgi:hypothetical protein